MPTGLRLSFGEAMLDIAKVQERLDAELAGIANLAIVDLIHHLLVTPRCEFREWNYGTPGQTFECWIVLEHRTSNTCIAFSEHGFGPAYPWGLLFIQGPNLSMGMDSEWFLSLEDAIRSSMAWDGENPDGYEVQ